MHKEILTKEQLNILPRLKNIPIDFGMVGGTAIALRVGHRKSYDINLFSNKSFDNTKIRQAISSIGKIDRVIQDELDHYEMIIDGVRITFLHYPFKINFKKNMKILIPMPSLLALSAVKAYALGRRAKWKDYIDLYFVIKNYHSIDDIIKEAKKIFGQEFNEKRFRIQLSYFLDVDKSEEVIFLPGYEVSDKEIQDELIRWSIS